MLYIVLMEEVFGVYNVILGAETMALLGMGLMQYRWWRERKDEKLRKQLDDQAALISQRNIWRNRAIRENEQWKAYKHDTTKDKRFSSKA